MRIVWFIVLVLAGISAKVFFESKVERGALQLQHEQVAARVKRMQAELPFTYKDMLRVERIEFVERRLQYRAVLLGRWELSDSGKPKLQERLRSLYCETDLPGLGLSTEYVIHTPSHSLSDIKGETWSALIHPGQCRTT